MLISRLSSSMRVESLALCLLSAALIPDAVIAQTAQSQPSSAQLTR